MKICQVTNKILINAESLIETAGNQRKRADKEPKDLTKALKYNEFMIMCVGRPRDGKRSQGNNNNHQSTIEFLKREA